MGIHCSDHTFHKVVLALAVVAVAVVELVSVQQ